MRIIAVAACLAVTHVSSLSAQDALDDLKASKACARIKNDAKRLECFDLIFRKSSETKKLEKSEWVVREEKSKIDDSTNVFVTLDSTQPVRNQYGELNKVKIAIYCRENKTNFVIIFGDYFMFDNGDYGKVIFRVDKKPATRKRLTASTDHEALGLWNGASAIAFIKTLFGGSTLFVRATPFTESSVSAEFDITGLQEAIIPLRRACGW